MKRYVPFGLLVIMGLLVFGLGLDDSLNFQSLKTHHTFMQQQIQKALTLSLLIYSLTYIGVVALSIPGATFMTLLGGFFFPFWTAFSAVVFSATVGATIFFLAFFYTRIDFFKKSKKLHTLQQRLHTNAFYYLLTLRLIPLFPFALVNAAAALIRMPLHSFIAGTFIGIIPGSIVYILLGQGLHTFIHEENLGWHFFKKPSVFWGLMGLGLLSLIPLVYKHFFQKQPTSDKNAPPLSSNKALKK